MNVEVHLLSQSQPIRRSDVLNAYVKGGLYCLLDTNGRVEKFPLCNIFRVVEDYEGAA